MIMLSCIPFISLVHWRHYKENSWTSTYPLKKPTAPPPPHLSKKESRLANLYLILLMYLRGGGGTDKWGKKLECWPWLASWPAQLEDNGPLGVIFTMMDAGKGNPCCLTWQELLSCVHLAIQLLVYSTSEFGHDADQSQHSSLRPQW